MKNLMDTIKSLKGDIEKLDLEKEKKKNEIHELLAQLKPQLDGKKKFKYEGEWYSIKSKNGRMFIVNFKDVEPGSWKRKKQP